MIVFFIRNDGEVCAKGSKLDRFDVISSEYGNKNNLCSTKSGCRTCNHTRKSKGGV